MMKKIVVLFALLASIGQAFAQSRFSFSGTITDTHTAAIRGANVNLLNTNYSTITDAKGAFRFNNVPAGTYTLHVSSVAFASVNQTVTIGNDRQSTSIQLSEAIAWMKL
jgi:hypothetical protein